MVCSGFPYGVPMMVCSGFPMVIYSFPAGERLLATNRRRRGRTDNFTCGSVAARKSYFPEFPMVANPPKHPSTIQKHVLLNPNRRKLNSQ